MLMHFDSNSKFLCLDLGSKVIGMAYYKKNETPYPLGNDRIIVKSQKQSIDEIINLVEDDFFTHLIIGVPFFTDGSESETTLKTRAFIKKMKEELKKRNLGDIKVYEQDETLSTFQAKERMQNSPEFNFKIDMKKIDIVSAQIILEDFLKNNLKE